MADPKVLILMGSASDFEVMKAAAQVLHDMDVPFQMTVASAHRSPDRAHELGSEARSRGIEVIIAGAGHAAHLAGVLAAVSELPVLGVPIDSSALQGLDSLLATVQMPGGVPVATMGIGRSGAKNAGMFAVRMLALGDEALARRLADKRKSMAEGVLQAAEEVEKKTRDAFS